MWGHLALGEFIRYTPSPCMPPVMESRGEQPLSRPRPGRVGAAGSSWGWPAAVRSGLCAGPGRGGLTAARSLPSASAGSSRFPNNWSATRSANVGEPYNPATVREDIVRITHLGRFASVLATVQPQKDGGVTLTYVVTELPLLSDVQVVGNKALSDQELLALAGLKAGDPKDQFLIDRGIREIKRAYEKKGYFVTDVTVDPEALNEADVLLYRVREGPRPRIRAIAYQGNTTFTDDQLQSKITSKPQFLFLRKGELNNEQLDQDAAKIRDFYHERGYLDAQVGRRIDVSPDQKRAVVTFLVQEGRGTPWTRWFPKATTCSRARNCWKPWP